MLSAKAGRKTHCWPLAPMRLANKRLLWHWILKGCKYHSALLVCQLCLCCRAGRHGDRICFTLSKDGKANSSNCRKEFAQFARRFTMHRIPTHNIRFPTPCRPDGLSRGETFHLAAEFPTEREGVKSACSSRSGPSTFLGGKASHTVRFRLGLRRALKVQELQGLSYRARAATRDGPN